MPVTFACLCGKKLQVPDEFAGKKATCPGCRRTLEVPPATAPILEEGIISTELVEPPPLPLQQYAPQQDWGTMNQGGTAPADLPPADLPNHDRTPLPRTVDLFAPPPPEIGPLQSGYSNLHRDKEPVSPAVRLIWIFGSLIIGLLLMAVFVVLRQPLLVIILLGLTLLASLLGWLLTRFDYRCTYVGQDGVARFTCNGSRENLRGQVFLFANGSELRTSQTRHFYNGAYTGTHYHFNWTDFNGKKVFAHGGIYRDLKGHPKSKDPFYFGTAAELAWTMYLLRDAPRQLEAGGSIRFGLKGSDSLRLGSGFIILTRRGETITLQGDDIARVRIQQGTVAILEPGAREGWFSSSGVYKFQYGQLANAQFFLILMEQLLGVRANT